MCVTSWLTAATPISSAIGSARAEACPARRREQGGGVPSSASSMSAWWNMIPTGSSPSPILVASRSREFVARQPDPLAMGKPVEVHGQLDQVREVKRRGAGFP